jgi:hypothetical protein
MSEKERSKPIRPSGFSPDNLPPEILRGIGDVIACWSYVEFQLAVLIREAVNISRAMGRVFMADMSIHMLCETAKTITLDATWIPDEKLRADITALANAIDGTTQSRHAYAHGVFGFLIEEESNALARYIQKGGRYERNRIEPDVKKVTPEGLKKIADAAHNLGVRAQNLTTRVREQKRSRGLPPPC